MTEESLALDIYHRQDALNCRLSPDWKTNNWPYHIAAGIEAAEGIGHCTTWAWWKSNGYGKPTQGEDLAQVYLELVDILHFGVSMDIIEASKYPAEAQAIITQQSSNLVRMFRLKDNFIEDSAMIGGDYSVDCLQDFMINVLREKFFSRRRFAKACLAFGMDFRRLVLYYHGKRTLNEFRWNNDDYKNKKYIKQWHIPGQDKVVEDNIVLAQYLEGLIANPVANGDPLHFFGHMTSSVADLQAHLANSYSYSKFWPKT